MHHMRVIYTLYVYIISKYILHILHSEWRIWAGEELQCLRQHHMHHMHLIYILYVYIIFKYILYILHSAWRIWAGEELQCLQQHLMHHTAVMYFDFSNGWSFHGNS